MQSHHKKIKIIQLILLTFTSALLLIINTTQTQHYVLDKVFTSNKNVSSIISNKFNNYLLLIENKIKSNSSTFETIIEEYSHADNAYQRTIKINQLTSQTYFLLNDELGFESISLFYDNGLVQTSLHFGEEVNIDYKKIKNQAIHDEILFITDGSNYLNTMMNKPNKLPILYKYNDLILMTYLNLNNHYLQSDIENFKVAIIGEDIAYNIQGDISSHSIKNTLTNIKKGNQYFIDSHNHYVTYEKTINDTYIITYTDISSLNLDWHHYLIIILIFDILILGVSYLISLKLSHYITKPIERFTKQVYNTKDFTKIKPESLYDDKKVISKWFSNLPIRNKIFSYLIISVTLPLTIISIFSILLTPVVIHNRIDFSSNTLIEMTSNNISEQFVISEMALNSTILNDYMQLYLIKQNDYKIIKSRLNTSSIPQKTLETYLDENYINDLGYTKINDQLTFDIVMNQIRKNGLFTTLVDSIALYNADGKLINFSDYSKTNTLNVENTNQYVYQNGKITLTKTVNSLYPTLINTENVPIIQRNIGYVQININMEKLYLTYNQLQLGDNSQVYIIDDTNTIISSRDSFVNNETFSNMLEENNDHFLFFRKNLDIKNNWSIITYFPKSDIRVQYTPLILTNIVVLCILILFIIILSMLLSKNVIKRLSSIHEQIKSIKNFDHHIIINSKNDEVSLLVNSFNNMIDRLNMLVLEINNRKAEYQKLETLKKEAELIAYQTQINPHFLYNVFTSINIMIKRKKNEEASQMLVAVSKLFKLSIYRNIIMVPLKDEIDHLKTYAMVQKIRFKDKIKIHINIEENLLNYKVLKFILQPLVENAFHHGLEPIGEGNLWIDIKIEFMKLVILIKDDGIGIEVDKLNQIKSSIKNHDVTVHLGLANVNQRIQLHNGNEYGLRIESRKSQGTSVIITLPLIE